MYVDPPKDPNVSPAEELARITQTLPDLRLQLQALQEQCEKMEARGRDLLSVVERQLSGRPENG